MEGKLKMEIIDNGSTVTVIERDGKGMVYYVRTDGRRDHVRTAGGTLQPFKATAKTLAKVIRREIERKPLIGKRI